MARRLKKTKPLIYVFCEGESEQAYTDFLKHKFADVAVIKRPSATGLFEEAEAKYKKDLNISAVQKLQMKSGFSLTWKQRISENGINESRL